MDWVHITPPNPGDATPGPCDNYFYSLHACTCRHSASWSVYRTQLFLFHIQKLKRFSPPLTTRLSVRPRQHTKYYRKHWVISPFSSVHTCTHTYPGFIWGCREPSWDWWPWIDYTPWDVHVLCTQAAIDAYSYRQLLHYYCATCIALPYFHSTVLALIIQTF